METDQQFSSDERRKGTSSLTRRRSFNRSSGSRESLQILTRPVPLTAIEATMISTPSTYEENVSPAVKVSLTYSPPIDTSAETTPLMHSSLLGTSAGQFPMTYSPLLQTTAKMFMLSELVATTGEQESLMSSPLPIASAVEKMHVTHSPLQFASEEIVPLIQSQRLVSSPLIHSTLLTTSAGSVPSVPSSLPASSSLTVPLLHSSFQHSQYIKRNSSFLPGNQDTNDCPTTMPVVQTPYGYSEALQKPRDLLRCKWLECGLEFGCMNDLVGHVNGYHVRNKKSDVGYHCKWIGCPRKGVGFSERYKMIIHIRTHTREKPHECFRCGKAFSRPGNLKIHKRSHTGEKPYRCQFEGCKKAYSNSSDRVKHARTHKEDKPYVCQMPGCNKRYTDPSSLRKHVKTKHYHPERVQST